MLTHTQSKGTLLTGKQFNERYKQEFYKLTVGGNQHNGSDKVCQTNSLVCAFQFLDGFCDGLNIDAVKFNPDGSCSAIGINFIEKSKMHMQSFFCIEFIRKVTIPDDAQVYVEDDEFKTNKIILGPMQKIFDDIEMTKYLISGNGALLKKVPKGLITKELCELAVYNPVYSDLFLDECVLEYVPEYIQTQEMCEYAFNKNLNNFRFMADKFKTIEMCKLALHMGAGMMRRVPAHIRTPEILDLYKSSQKNKENVWMNICGKITGMFT